MVNKNCLRTGPTTPHASPDRRDKSKTQDPSCNNKEQHGRIVRPKFEPKNAKFSVPNIKKQKLLPIHSNPRKSQEKDQQETTDPVTPIPIQTKNSRRINPKPTAMEVRRRQLMGARI
jgi:hypothetical protein